MRIRTTSGFKFGHDSLLKKTKHNNKEELTAEDGIEYVKEVINYWHSSGEFDKNPEVITQLFIDNQDKFSNYEVRTFIVESKNSKNIDMCYLKKLSKKTINAGKRYYTEQITQTEQRLSQDKYERRDYDFYPHVHAYVNKVEELESEGEKVSWQHRYGNDAKSASSFLSNFLEDVKPNEKYFFKKGKEKLAHHIKMCSDIQNYITLTSLIEQKEDEIVSLGKQLGEYNEIIETYTNSLEQQNVNEIEK